MDAFFSFTQPGKVVLSQLFDFYLALYPVLDKQDPVVSQVLNISLTINTAMLPLMIWSGYGLPLGSWIRNDGQSSVSTSIGNVCRNMKLQEDVKMSLHHIKKY